MKSRYTRRFGNSVCSGVHDKRITDKARKHGSLSNLSPWKQSFAFFFVILIPAQVSLVFLKFTYTNVVVVNKHWTGLWTTE
jgi:hypothetical protein